MTNPGHTLIDNTVQCLGCPIFDRLFQVVSDAAGKVYGTFATFSTLLLCVLLAFFIIYAVWKNMKSSDTSGLITKSLKPAIINSMIALTLLGTGLALPRFISRITFEPAAEIAIIYTQSMIQSNPDIVDEKVTYQPAPMNDNGFYRPQLRDDIIMLMKTTITQFQSYMKLGLAVMDAAFSWKMLLGIGALLRHIIWFVIGAYLFYAFARLFVRFGFYFADIIVAMAFFAFFFPLSIIMVSFKGAANVPKWISGIGKNLGVDQFKRLINAIITLGAAILTYTVIMVLIAKFFSQPGQSVNDLMSLILSGDVFAADLSDDNLASMTLVGAVVLAYVMNVLYDQIPQVSKMVLSAFNVSEENKISEQLANDAMQLTGVIVDTVKKTGDTIMSAGDKKKDGGK